MIVSVAGTDGAGKSTVTRLAAERLTRAGVPIERVERWDIVDNPRYPAARLLRPDVPTARTCVADMPAGPRFLFLMWSIDMALVGRAPGNGRDGAVTLLDGYWMKHAASEIAYGLDRAWVESVVAGLPPSRTVVYLRLEPEEAWERKVGRDLVPYECAMDPACSRESFLTHQRRILDVLDSWASRFGWREIDAAQALDTVVDHVVTHVAGRVTDDAHRAASAAETGAR
ncbi:thymidylate kinase [Streptomyces caelestis]|uniref:Thymidylate kinase n=2 Tax=Streptomyces TaxID=1883 RepID=A0A0M8QGK2_9ACTN|nr:MULTISPECIES: thymidylate kinase [Streptomyces]KOT30504.1 thymidylate kinase [Streptomyces caelestis]KOV24013.1 thymidylate kinase [Streptomyces sp. XY152]